VDLKILNNTKYEKNKMGSHNFMENKLKGITKTLGQNIWGLVGNG
jgi:hypothetical protein